MVITASRLEMPKNATGKSIEVLTAEDIQAYQPKDLFDALQLVPGVNVTRTGGPGGNTSVSIRGSTSRHVLFLLDGIRMNDPASSDGSYNFTHVSPDNIERIEVLKGPHSALYGSEAMGGVINIITKKGAEGDKSSLVLEGGTYNTYSLGASTSGQVGTQQYSASISYYDTEGFSATTRDGEDDGTERLTVSGRYMNQVTDALKLGLSVRYIDAEGEYDEFSSPNGTLESEQVYASLLAQYVMGNWIQDLELAYAQNERAFTDVLDPSEFDGSSTQFYWKNVYAVSDAQRALFGLDFVYEEASSANLDDDTTQLAPYLEWLSDWNQQVSTTAGLRYTDHSEFDGEVTWNLSALYRASDDTRFNAAAGSGYKAPTLDNLFGFYDFSFGQVVGNPDLDPESNLGWEIGVEQDLMKKKVVLGLTYYQTRYEDYIQFTDPDGFMGPAPASYVNVDAADVQGIELSAIYFINDSWTINVDYTWLDVDNKGEDPALRFDLCKPEHLVQFRLNYLPTLSSRISFWGQYQSEREDFSETMDSFVLLNLSASLEVSDSVELFGRIENLLDEDYELAAGFNTPGLSVFGGVRASF